MTMAQMLNYEQSLYDYLQSIAPVPPELWTHLLDRVEIKSYHKKRHLSGQLFDIRIVLEGMVIKRRDDKDADNHDVLDFIGGGQCIFHIERIDNCYFETDTPCAIALLTREDLQQTAEMHPIFVRHIRHLFIDILRRRTFRGKLINLQGIDKKLLFKKEYPEAFKYSAVKDKSSFLGMTPTHYSNLDI